MSRSREQSVNDSSLDQVADESISEREVLQSDLDASELLGLVKANNRLKLFRSWVDVAPNILVLLVSAYCASFWELKTSASAYYDGPLSEGLSLLLYTMTLALCLLIAFQLLNQRFEINDDEIVIVRGILNPVMKRSIRVPYESIQAVEITRNIYQRLVHVGDLRVSTTLFDQPEIVLDGIYSPDLYRSLIRKKIDESALSMAASKAAAARVSKDLA